jgi:hypothetical protein
MLPITVTGIINLLIPQSYAAHNCIVEILCIEDFYATTPANSNLVAKELARFARQVRELRVIFLSLIFCCHFLLHRHDRKARLL